MVSVRDRIRHHAVDDIGPAHQAPRPTDVPRRPPASGSAVVDLRGRLVADGPRPPVGLPERLRQRLRVLNPDRRARGRRARAPDVLGRDRIAVPLAPRTDAAGSRIRVQQPVEPVGRYLRRVGGARCEYRWRRSGRRAGSHDHRHRGNRRSRQGRSRAHHHPPVYHQDASSRTPRPRRPGRSRRSDGVPVAEGGGFEPPRDVTPNTDSSRAP
jgi:hypothetical protein